jgi:hypothetical protein
VYATASIEGTPSPMTVSQYPWGWLIATAVVVLPILLISAVTALVALVAVYSPSASVRKHSLQVLARLTDFARALRSRS